MSTCRCIGAVPVASAVLFDLGVFSLVVGATVLMLIALAHQSIRSRGCAAARAPPSTRREASDGARPRDRHRHAGGSGVWLLLRPRTFQVIIGLSLLSYAVNLFIFAWAGCAMDAPPDPRPGRAGRSGGYADPLPQALVLTAIVISFATTALFLVVLLASRGLTGTDHVDGRERGWTAWPII